MVINDAMMIQFKKTVKAEGSLDDDSPMFC